MRGPRRGTRSKRRKGGLRRSRGSRSSRSRKQEKAGTNDLRPAAMRFCGRSLDLPGPCVVLGPPSPVLPGPSRDGVTRTPMPPRALPSPARATAGAARPAVHHSTEPYMTPWKLLCYILCTQLCWGFGDGRGQSRSPGFCLQGLAREASLAPSGSAQRWPVRRAVGRAARESVLAIQWNICLSLSLYTYIYIYMYIYYILYVIIYIYVSFSLSLYTYIYIYIHTLSLYVTNT